MKHSLKITAILLSMFFFTQLIGLVVIGNYDPEIKQVIDKNGTVVNVTKHNLPYGIDIPEKQKPGINLISVIIAMAIAITIMILLMYIKAEIFLRYWFFIVIILALGISINSFLIGVEYSSIIALVIGLVLAYIKVFKRSIIVHNITEILIYPGIAVIFVALFNVWAVVGLLILISAYDMYAVWHSGIMQKMAKYQIKKVKVFSGFFVPYLGRNERKIFEKLKKSKKKDKKIKVNVAILGGGDVVFPLILAGTVMRALGFFPALIVSICATLALTYLFYISKKGKFYPAMPFITIGCFIGLVVAYLI